MHNRSTMPLKSAQTEVGFLGGPLSSKLLWKNGSS